MFTLETENPINLGIGEKASGAFGVLSPAAGMVILSGKKVKLPLGTGVTVKAEHTGKPVRVKLPSAFVVVVVVAPPLT